jgi:large subunit ribosomal protein L24
LALPRQGTLALDIGKATLAGVDAQGLSARIKFDAGALQIERLLIAELGGTALAINGRIDELSSQPRGRVSIELSAGALTGLAGVIAKYAPRTADLFRRAADRLAPAKMHGSLTVERAATTGSSAKLALNGQLGLLRIALNGEASGEPSRLDAANLRIDSRLDADDATTLTALFGLDRIIGVDQLPGDVTLSATGPLNGELRIDGAAAASGLTAAVRGAVRLSGPAARSGQFQVLATVADVRPLQQAMTGQPGSPVAISARSAVAVTGEAVSLSQIAIAAGKASVRGQLAVNLSSPIEINGDLAADNVDGAWLTAMVLGLPAKAPGAAGLWSGQPFGAGAFTAMNGAVAFSFDRAAFTPALFASNLKGVAQFRPTEITLKNLTGNLAGGGVSGELAFRRNADGLVGHGHIALADADAATILGADKKTIDARLTLNSDIDSLGANPAALVRALHGGGAVTLTDAHIAGLDTRAFVAAMRAADQGPTIEPAKIQPAVNAALTAGRLVVPQGDAVLTITDGKASVANVTLPAQDGAALALAGTLDLNTASLDTRMTLSGAPPAHALIRVRPELSVTLKGPLAAPARTLDISALTGWLTLRAAELQTRRLESIEANGRSDAVGRSFRPDVPVVRMAPAGEIVESERLANVAAPTAAARGLDLLQPEVPAAAATGSTTSARPRAAPQPPLPKPPPPPPNAAGPALSAPLDLLFRPQN